MNFVLQPDYYLKNFNTMMNFVVEQYADLLVENEWNFIRNYQSLSPDAAKLFVRLCLRQKNIYFTDQLVYSEIASLNDALNELNELRFVLINPLIHESEVLQALTKPELKYLFSNRKINHNKPKALVVDNILKAYSSDVIYELIFAAKTLICKNCESEVQALLYFFFGNRHQDLSEFVLQDMGRVKYESYTIEKESRLFPNRVDFENSLLFARLSEESYLAVEADDIATINEILSKLPRISNNRKLVSQKEKILNRCAAYFEKKKLLTEALSLYQQTERLPSRERQARILNTLGFQNQALDICNEILQNSYSEDEQYFAESFILKLNSNKNKKLSSIEIPQETYVLAKNSNKSVELIALEYFKSQFHKVYFLENALMNSLFGLWFWDEIFMPIQGSFCHPFQRGPVDLFTDEFVQARKEKIREKLNALKDEPSKIKGTILETFTCKNGIANYFVDWELFTIEVLELTLKCIPFHHLHAIFERLLSGLKENCSGFPDLIAFTKDLEAYELIEIKGPGDKLQNNQMRWFQYFLKNSISCKLVRIEWLEN